MRDFLRMVLIRSSGSELRIGSNQRERYCFVKLGEEAMYSGMKQEYCGYGALCRCNVVSGVH